MKRWAWLVLPAATLLALGAASLWSRLEDSACRNTPIEIVVSPDGKFKAVLFDRDCGATTGFSSQISIILANEDLPNEGGNVFVADLPAGTAGSEPRPYVEMRWRSERIVELRYEPAARLFKNEQSVLGISVIYVGATPRPD